MPKVPELPSPLIRRISNVAEHPSKTIIYTSFPVSKQAYERVGKLIEDIKVRQKVKA